MYVNDLHDLWEEAPETLILLAKHKAPPTENAIAKGIPVTEENLNIIHRANQCLNSGMRVRVVYRGPRRKGWVGQSTCLKKDATTFAVYYDYRDRS